MNELKPEDVMRALEHCATEAKCDGCPFEEKPHCDTEMMECVIALLREKDAEIERLNDECEIKFETRFGKITIPKMRSLGEGAELIYKEIRAEAITEFVDLAIKRICEKVVAPTPSESYIVEKCNQIIYETAKEMRGKTDGKSDL